VSFTEVSKRAKTVACPFAESLTGWIHPDRRSSHVRSCGGRSLLDRPVAVNGTRRSSGPHRATRCRCLLEWASLTGAAMQDHARGSTISRATTR